MTPPAVDPGTADYPPVAVLGSTHATPHTVGVDVWPTLDAFAARLGGHAWQDTADEDDAQQALDAAVAYVVERSTRYRRNGTDAAVYRGTLDLAVSLYERRGSNVDPFDGLTPAQRSSFFRLLGISRHALPFIGGAGAATVDGSTALTVAAHATTDHAGLPGVGVPGGSILSAWWSYSPDTDPPPGTGQVRTSGFDSVGQAGTVYLSSIDDDGLDWTPVTPAAGDRLWLRSASGETWVVDLDAVSPGTGYSTLDGTLASGTATPPRRNERVQVSLVREATP